MNKPTKNNKVAQSFLHVLAVMIAFTLFVTAIHAQTTGGTVISNQASAAYSDGNGNNFSTVSNTVTVTVANVSGLTITPDAGTRASVVPGQTNVLYSFRVTNTGNFADQVRFLANGASIQATNSTVTNAVIDVDGSGTVNAGDTNIFSNGADVLSASIAKGGFIDVLVVVTVNTAAASGSTVNVSQLGDATTGSPSFDNQATTGAPSAHEVRTVATTSVNGLREARGDISATVDTDALVQLGITYPAGPVALGSNINYGLQVCNTGLRPAQSITLSGAPAGSNTGVFIIAPIPVGTSLAATQTPAFPAGTLYTTSPLTTAPTAATWTTTPPGTLSTVTRVAFNTGSTLAASACSTSVNMAVTVTTTDATNNIYEIADVFANSVGGQITDQSGDTVSNKGDGNANFTEPITGGTASPTQGFQVVTTLAKTGAVLIGPNAQPAATGPTSTNDDYTNRSVTTGIAGVAPGGVTTASGQVVFTNTVKNNGNASDTFVISRQSAPAGFTVEVSLDNGTTYTTVTTNTLNLPLAFGAQANVLVRVTAPAGQTVMTGYPVVMRATSTTTPGAFNETIDRLYTGALQMVKSSTIINGTGVGAATDPVPGAIIEYTITYTNVTSNGGANSGGLTISNLVITENGNTAPNNWGTTTTQVVGSSSDSNSGTITGDTAGSTLLTDTVPTLAPQATGTFKFRRTIN